MTLGGPVKTVTTLAVLLVAAAGMLVAQETWPRGFRPPPDHQRPNQDPERLNTLESFGGRRHLVSAGFGGVGALMGVRYLHRLGGSPIGIGLGVGAVGVVPHLELGIPGGGLIFKRGETELFFGVAGLFGYAGNYRNTTSVVFEFGERTWFGAHRRSYIEGGLGVASRVRGQDAGLVPFIPRLQFGFAF